MDAINRFRSAIESAQNSNDFEPLLAILHEAQHTSSEIHKLLMQGTLPQIKPETAFSVMQSLPSTTADQLKMLESKEPFISDFLKRVNIEHYLEPQEFASVIYTALITYRLIESQVQADQMNKEMR